MTVWVLILIFHANPDGRLFVGVFGTQAMCEHFVADNPNPDLRCIESTVKKYP